MASDTSDTPDAILGQEFLTWLWFQSDVAHSFFHTEDGQAFMVYMEKRVTVTGFVGCDRETASVTASDTASPLTEARLGLRRGKKVSSAIISLSKADCDFNFSVKAADFSLNSLKTSKINKPDRDDDPDALFLEKSFLSKPPLPSWTASTVSFSVSGSTRISGIRRRVR